MEKNEDRKYMGILIWSIFIIIFGIIGNKIKNDIKYNEQQKEKNKQEFKVDSVKTDPVKTDTIIATNNPWPIKVVSVELSDLDNDPKFRVITENGVMYYTNKKPKVGDIAFYINDNDDITDKDGNVEIARQ